jgi:mono/diheme cytochrome c family protein
MPAWKDVLSAHEVGAIIAYVRESFRDETPAAD